MTWTAVPSERFHFESSEELRWYASSEQVRWGFCGRCGSSMLYEARSEGHADSAPGRVYVTVASLIDPIDRPPSAHVSYEERLPWYQAHDRLPKYRAKGDELLEGEEPIQK